MNPRSYITIGVILLMIVLFQQGSTYAGRVDDRNTAVQNCKDAAIGRSGLVLLATAVEDGFKSTDDRVGEPLTLSRIAAENKVRSAIDAFKKRAALNCENINPKPPIFQFSS